MKRIALFAAPALVLAACSGSPEAPEDVLAAARACTTPADAEILTVEGPATTQVGLANTEASERYLSAVLEEACVYQLPSGLIFRIRTAVDEGASPEYGDLVTVHYTGQFPNGETFDSSRLRGEPATFPSNRLIRGWVEALPLMREHAPGSIVNISSIAGLIASDTMPAYNASKASVWMLSKSIALHCAKNNMQIRCNSVHPTFVDTPILDGTAKNHNIEKGVLMDKLARQIPLKFVGEPNDIANAVVYLASDESRFMTGAELKLDGGISAM